ncbi:hypothetical protein Lepto7375DRAFT_7212 [Leptolyngbya sp. PCC 7375]|nr:hypothetical protein Lepto7375DRAFT_7212 [Leptolyngbya sp. PCC 7375]
MKLDTLNLSIQSLAEETQTIINDNYDSRVQILKTETRLSEIRTRIETAKVVHSLCVNGNKDLKNADMRKAALDKAVSEDKAISELTQELNKLKYDLEIMKIEMQHGNETMRFNLELIKALGNNSITKIE